MAADNLIGNYVVTLLVSSGTVVAGAALLAIPAVRALKDPPKRGALIATVIALLVIPVFAGGRATVHYLEDRDDFTAVPDICTSDAVSQDQIAELIADPPEPELDSFTTSATCDWKRTADDGDAAELNLYLSKYDNSRSAARSLERDKEYYDNDGKTVVDVKLGDEAIRRWYDGSIDSEDTLGVAFVIRVDNLILEAEFDHAKDLGEPSADQLEALATELVREIEAQKPTR